ncbi:MAG: hypothetical protein PF481_01315 [Bacteroidales bacterium]|jgi:hypothetical protein|nr:hypothetical protein [Bacteroidales bacterium]
MKNLILLLFLATITFSCTRVKEKTKETINESGEIVGKSTSEFIKGVSDGVKESLACEIILSENIRTQGLSYGKTEVTSNSK